MNLEKIFNPVSTAIIGASEEEGSVGAGLVKNLMASQKNIFCVNPFRKQVFKWIALLKLLILKKSLIWQ